MNWTCICGNFVHERRFCPRCKLVRFRLDDAPVLDYFGPRLGQAGNGLSFNFPMSLLSNHVLVSGQTGTGKTRFGMNLVAKAFSQNDQLRVLIVDVEGEWKSIIPKIKGQVQYYSAGRNLKINPFDLRDPGLIRELMRETVFKGIEKEYVDLSAQMNFVLQEAINESRSIQELVDNIKSYDRQKLTAIEKTKTALLVRLDPFLRSPLKEIFLCKKSNPDFSRLDESNVIIDLHELDSLVAYNLELRLIYNTITTYFLRKMLNRGTRDWVSNLVVLEEAQELVPRILHKLIITESWPATVFATRLRKRGCGMVLLTQSPSNLEKDIIKNCATKITFRLQHREDIKLIADSAGFNDPVEVSYLSDKFSKLQKKETIVSIAGYEPFLVTSDDFEAGTFEDAPWVIQADEPKKSGEEKVFLESIIREPFLTVTERRSYLGWDDKKFGKMVNSLLAKKRVERVKVKLGRGSPRILYQKPGTIPSIRHEFYVNWISDKLRQKGYVVSTTKDGPDIIVKDANTAIEVELGKSNVAGNIRRNTKEYRKTVVALDNKKLLESWKRENTTPNVCFAQIQKVPAIFEKKKTKNELRNI